MPLEPGTRLGPYEVTAQIGAGGMGEVYRAHDTKLDRDVALKILPEAFTDDPERLARFQREAKVLASLNHPNIAAIYGLEDSGETHALVLELVEGPTLADRISQGAIPLEEALPVAKQIAEALEAAHEQGIIHRDLKPANIKVRPDGTVKVLDFGLAKALEPERTEADVANSPTMSMTAAATQMGMIMGTAAYMSPEQAAGQPVDRRADIWAFGVVFWEMLTGQQLFTGESISHVLASVLRSEPDWARLPVSTPSYLKKLLRRCLDKKPQRRLPHIGLARLEIDEDATDPHENDRVAAGAGTGRPYGWVAAAGLLLTTMAFGTAWLIERNTTETAVARLSIQPPTGFTLAPGGPLERGGLHPLTIAPDGREVAFVTIDDQGRRNLWVRPLEAEQAVMLPGTEGASSPFWSPDGQWVAFFAANTLRRVAPSGGPVTTIGPAQGGARGVWYGDRIFFEQSSARESAQMWVIPSGGGEPAAAEFSVRFTSVLPDGKSFVYTESDLDSSASRAYAGPLDADEGVLIVPRIDTGPVLFNDGYLLFLRDRTLWAQPFDPARLEVGGDAIAIADRVSNTTFTPGQGVFDVSDNGVLVFQKATPEVQSTLVWVDRAGTRLDVVAETGIYGGIELSPDGSQAAVTVYDEPSGNPDIWLFDLSRGGISSPFTTETNGLNGVWAPDGSQLAFLDPRVTGQQVLAVRAVNGDEPARVLIDDTYYNRPTSWSADGRLLLFSKGSSYISPEETRGDLLVLPMADEGEAFPVVETAATERAGRISPSGRWLAFQSNESGRLEIHVTPFPDGGARTRVSLTGGSFPRWSRDGTQLFFLSADQTLMAAPVREVGDRLEFGEIQPLFRLRPPPRGTSRTRVGAQESPYDVSPDGQRFLVNVTDRELEPSYISVILNWPALLRR